MLFHRTLLAPSRLHARRLPLSRPQPLRRRVAPAVARPYSAAAALTPPADLSDAEAAIFAKLAAGLPGTAVLRVQDISGGCGSMYGIEVESAAFQGLSMVKQQRLVNELLKEELKQWHGVQLRTKAC